MLILGPLWLHQRAWDRMPIFPHEGQKVFLLASMAGAAVSVLVSLALPERAIVIRARDAVFLDLDRPDSQVRLRWSEAIWVDATCYAGGRRRRYYRLDFVVGFPDGRAVHLINYSDPLDAERLNRRLPDIASIESQLAMNLVPKGASETYRRAECLGAYAAGLEKRLQPDFYRIMSSPGHPAP